MRVPPQKFLISYGSARNMAGGEIFVLMTEIFSKFKRPVTCQDCVYGVLYKKKSSFYCDLAQNIMADICNSYSDWLKL